MLNSDKDKDYYAWITKIDYIFAVQTEVVYIIIGNKLIFGLSSKKVKINNKSNEKIK